MVCRAFTSIKVSTLRRRLARDVKGIGHMMGKKSMFGNPV